MEQVVISNPITPYDMELTRQASMRFFVSATYEDFKKISDQSSQSIAQIENDRQATKNKITESVNNIFNRSRKDTGGSAKIGGNTQVRYDNLMNDLTHAFPDAQNILRNQIFTSDKMDSTQKYLNLLSSKERIIAGLVQSKSISNYDNRIQAINDDAFSKFKASGKTIDVRFQFPLIVKSDSKGANWKEIDYKGAEPYAIFFGAKPRTINIEWTYIVDGTSRSYDNPSESIVWNTSAIEKQVKNLRKFFYNSVGQQLVIQFSAYSVVGISDKEPTWSFRSDGVNINYDGPIITDGGGRFYLQTKISMELKLLVNFDSSPGLEEKPPSRVGEVDLVSVKSFVDRLHWVKKIPTDKDFGWF